MREVPATLTLRWPQLRSRKKNLCSIHSTMVMQTGCGTVCGAFTFRYHTETCGTFLYSTYLFTNAPVFCATIVEECWWLDPILCSLVVAVSASVEKRSHWQRLSRCCRREAMRHSSGKRFFVPLKLRGPSFTWKKSALNWWHSRIESAEMGIRCRICQQNWRFELFELSNRQENWGGLP